MPTQVPVSELMGMKDHELPPSDWLEIDQDRIDLFADATGDHQFIHVDPERAAATPFGTTIAHGFLSLSLLPHLMEERSIVPEGTVMGINYGLNKVRFLEPVRVGSRVRARAHIADVQDKGGNRYLISSAVTVEIEGGEKPALVAETLAMFVVA